MTGLQTQLLGIPWMDPNWLLDHFHTEFVWVSLVIIFIECGLLFPFLPGDTLLFAFGLFLATDQLNLTTGPNWLELAIGIIAFTTAAFLGNVVGYEIGRAIGPPRTPSRRTDHQEEVPRPDRRLLREARQHGPGDRPLRAVRPYLRHRWSPVSAR